MTQRTGGFSTQIHERLKGLGNPLRLIVTAGQVHDRMPTSALIAQREAGHGMADKPYEADTLIPMTQDKDAAAVITPRANRTQPRKYEEHLYREQHWVERLIDKIKPYRRIFFNWRKSLE